MLKKQITLNKLPKLSSTESSISSKLYSLTGLRMFQAKFIEDLKPSKHQNNLLLFASSNLENLSGTIPPNLTNKQEVFVGKDITNDAKFADTKQIKIKEEKNKQLILKQIKPKSIVIKYKNLKPRGLKNLGNTCYMNAILQSIFTFEQFNVMLQKQFTSKNRQANTTLYYLKLYRKYKSSLQNQVISPHDFKSIIGKHNSRFVGKSQQDSQEFLTCILQKLNNQMTRVETKPSYQQLSGDTSKLSLKTIAQNWWQYFKLRDDSIICDYFQGQTETTILCSSCKFKTVSFDNYWGMPLSFGKQNQTLIQIISNSYGMQNHLQGYSCQKCKKQNTCSKRTKIFRLPKILVIQLKRFGYGYNTKKQKIKQKVEVNCDLNMKAVMSQDSIQQKFSYYLKSTVQHSGQINFGHYTSHVYSQKQQKWYLANDETIYQQQYEKDSPKLYLLFYFKK